MSEQHASLLPEAADQSGFLDGVTATIISARAAMFDYAGKRPDLEPVPAIAVNYRPHTEGGKDTVQNYTVGKAEHRVPSEDGLRFKVFGAKKGLPNDSNGLLFVRSLINAGFPVDKIGDDLSVFDNTVVLLRSEAQQKREGQTEARTIVLVDKVVTLPWENKTPAAGAKAAPKTAAKTAAPKAAAAPATAADPMADEGAKTAATEALVAILSDAKNANGAAKKDLGTAAFKILAQNPNRNNAVKLLSVKVTEFLASINGQPVQVGDEMKVITVSGDSITWGE